MTPGMSQGTAASRLPADLAALQAELARLRRQLVVLAILACATSLGCLIALADAMARHYRW